MFDIFCIGGSSLDLILRTPRLPVKDEKLVVDLKARTAGGFISNTACASARLGCRTAWSGTLGDDDFGNILRTSLREFGVDDSFVEIKPGETTDFCVILLDDTGERTILVVPTIHNTLNLTPGLITALSNSHIGYTLPHPPPWFHKFSSAIHNRGGKVALDIEGSSPVRGDDLQAVLKQCDMAFLSHDGLELACGTRDPLDGGKKLISMGIQQVVVTLGSRGAFAMDARAHVQVAGYPVKVVDTTGAGDCFHAAYLAGTLKGWTMGECLQFSNAAAAISVQHLGPRGGLPDFRQVVSFMENNS